ncbi:insulinase family protein [Promicromonospora sp. NPDC023805]|uniref:insulinase family protein n=1 Tax=Promicromonospora sp. NPDC023805 TaxID=3154696 RepID=UPI0033CC1993
MTTDAQTRPRELYAHRPGRATGGLVFRVGYADETLPTSGTTALVVALALRAVERPGLDVAASVGPAVTEVRVSGSDDRVRTTLRDLSRALADLPVRHRGTETRALRERAADGVALPPWRHGLQGYGLGPGEYTGLYRATDEHLRAWARERFAGPNAVAWFTGETAQDLDLPLPGAVGPAALPPPVHGPEQPLPADAPAGGARVLWDALVPDVPAAAVLAEVARRALFKNLRHDRGWTYDVSTSVDVLDGERVTLQIAAGLRPETAAAATGEFLDTWGRLRYAVDADELEAARAHLLVTFDEPHQEASWLPDGAVRTLLGRPVPTPAERRAALAAVTAADVVSLAHQAWDSGLLVAPVGQGWAGTSLVTRGAGEPVSGRAFERIDADATVVVGDAGATLRHGRTRTTVRFDETAVLLAHPDGGRLLVGLDGAQIPFEPTLHDDLGGPQIAQLVDRHVPDELMVHVPREAAPERPDKDQINRAARARADREVEEDGILRTAGAAAAGTGRAALEIGKLLVTLALILVLLAAFGGTFLSAVVVLGEVGGLLDGDGSWRKVALTVAAGLVSAGVTWLSYRAVLRLGGVDKGDPKND